MAITCKKYFDTYKQPNKLLENIQVCTQTAQENCEYRVFSTISDNIEFLAENFTG